MILVAPLLIAETLPVVVIVAIVVLPVIHVPPETASDSTPEVPTQRLEGPEIADGVGLTVIAVVAVPHDMV